VDAALFDGRGLRVLILVDHVLVGRLLHELPDLGFDPGGAEGGEILLGVAIPDELIVDGLVDGLRVLRCLGELVAISLLVQDLGLELAGRTSLEIFGIVQRHSFSCLFAFKVYLLPVEPPSHYRSDASSPSTHVLGRRTGLHRATALSGNCTLYPASTSSRRAVLLVRASFVSESARARIR
jgi:hypothetical protein